MEQIKEEVTAERHATWLELFYDLIFVVAISKVTHTLSHAHHGHITPEMYVKYILMFIPVWWAWVGHTLYANRFKTDDIPHRLLTLLQMFFIILLSVFVNPDFEPNFMGFVLSYVAVRAILILMYVRAIKLNPQKAVVSKYFAKYFSIGLLVSLSAVLFPGDLKFVVLYLGIAIDLLVPVLGRKTLKKFKVHNEHLPERFGLFTIIVLGESVLGISNAVQNVVWTASSIAIATLGFLIIACIWWIYFEILEKNVARKNLASGQLIIYSHLFIYMGLGLMANFIIYSILQGEIMLQDYKFLAASGTLLFILPLETINFYCGHEARAKKTATASLLIVLLSVSSLLWLQSFAWIMPVLAVAFLIRAASLVYLSSPKLTLS